METGHETAEARVQELKDLERERGELLDTPRTAKRDEALDALGRLQRRIVDAISLARKNR